MFAVVVANCFTHKSASKLALIKSYKVPIHLYINWNVQCCLYIIPLANIHTGYFVGAACSYTSTVEDLSRSVGWFIRASPACTYKSY